MKLKRLLIIITAFAIAMGFLETAVVVYMREILYPGGFEFPLQPISPELAVTELFRELATLLMLLTVGMLGSLGMLGSGALSAGNGAGYTPGRFSTGFAWFLYCFAIWDIFYYVFLWVILGWPQSLMTWDVLFLIPTTWTGPVITPVLVALAMIGFALLILFRAEGSSGDKKESSSRIPWEIWTGMIAGSLVLVTGWVWDYSKHMLERFSPGEMLQVKNPEVLEWATSYEPGSFPWGIYATGLAIILTGMYFYWKMTWRKRN